jgi:hypothetical protein
MSESVLNSVVSLILQCKEGAKPHREGVFAARCADLVDLGIVKDVFQGQERMVHKLRLLFETDHRDEMGKAGLIGKTFTASLHQKSKLAGFVGSWRGRPVLPGESIDLSKLVGASCTLVISHRQNLMGRTYAAIDAVSKPTKQVAPSGQYDPAETRRRIAEWKAKDAGSTAAPVGAGAGASATRPLNPVAAAFPQRATAAPAAPKSEAAVPAAVGDFDPEVGF